MYNQIAKKRKRFVIDIDGVIATEVTDRVTLTDRDGKNSISINYFLAEPVQENIDFFNYLFEEGHEIIYFTARGYGTGVDWRVTTEAQLGSWGVKYNRLKFGKPPADYYIDDKFATIEELRKEFIDE